MTVEELIKRLERLPKHTEVKVPSLNSNGVMVDADLVNVGLLKNEDGREKQIVEITEDYWES